MLPPASAPGGGGSWGGLSMLTHATFLSPWYWVFGVLFWGLVCNYTFGVPNELFVRARKGGEDAALFERFARRNLALFAGAIRRRMVWAGAAGGFCLAVLGTVALRSGSEAALGLLILLLPAAALSAWGAAAILSAASEPPGREGLHRLFLRARLYAAGAAGVSMVGASYAAGFRHGPGWTYALLTGGF